MSTQEEGGLEGQKADLGKIDAYLETIKSVKSKGRHKIYAETADYVISLDPDHVTDAIFYLSQSESSYKDKVLDYLIKGDRSDKLQGALANSSLNPTEEILSRTAELSTDHPEVSRAMLKGFFGAPLTRFNKLRSAETLESAAKDITDITTNLARVLIKSDTLTRQKTTAVWRDDLVQTEGEEITDFDLLLYASMYSEDSSEYAQASLELMSVMEDLYLQQRAAFNYGYRLDELEKIGHTESKRLPYPALRGKIKAMESEVNTFLMNMEARPYNFFLPAPEKTDLGNESLRLRMQWHARRLEKEGASWEEVPFPGGTPFFVFWQGEMGEEAKPEIVRDNLRVFLQENEPGDTSRDNLTDAELNTLMNLIEIKNPEKLDENEKVLRLQALGGGHALKSSGDWALLNLPKEERFRKAGMRSIFFKPQEGGNIEATLDWKGWKYKVIFDRDLNLVGGEGLTDQNKSWLSSFFYTYLTSIRNPEAEKVKVLERVEKEGREEFVEVDKEERKTEIGRIAHLRVLPLEQKPQKISTEDIERASMLFGIDLNDLNRAFLEIQGNIDLLDELEPHMKMTILNQIEKTEQKEEEPRWSDTWTQEMGKEKYSYKAMQLENPPAGYDKRMGVYMITFVDEVPSKDPLIVSCPGAADRIENL